MLLLLHQLNKWYQDYLEWQAESLEVSLKEDAKISVFDSGYLVGDGVWEGFRVHSGRLLFIDEHFNRLWQGAKAIGLKINFSKKQLLENILKTLEVNEMNDGNEEQRVCVIW